MAVYITARHMIGGTRHEHIASAHRQKTTDSETGVSSREVMVDWIKNKGGKAFVRSLDRMVAVGVVEAFLVKELQGLGRSRTVSCGRSILKQSRPAETSILLEVGGWSLLSNLARG